MSADGSDSACCSSSILADNADRATDPSQANNWDSEAGADVDQSTDIPVGVFNQDDETAFVSFMDTTVRLEFPGSAKGVKTSDFRQFVKMYVGEENLEKLESVKYPNQWRMQVKTKEIRENLLRIWKTKIKNRICWINPYYDYELRGFLHWLPHFISDEDVKRQLSQFGDVLLLENKVHDYWNSEIKSEVKYFGLVLKDGMVKDDLPHFLKFGGYRTLVIVLGRKPACFHCREFGHNKKDCKKYKDKLDEYCKNPEARKPRTKPRGRRHRPDSDAKYEIEDNYQDETMSEDNHQSETKSIPIPEQNDTNLIKSCLKRSFSNRKSPDNKKEEILAILRSLKEWKKEITEMVKQTLKNIEENCRIIQTPSEPSESEAKQEIIAKLLDDMKGITIEMIDPTLNNLKNVVAGHFGLDSNEPLDKLIINLEKRKKEKMGLKEVRFVEEQLSSYLH